MIFATNGPRLPLAEHGLGLFRAAARSDLPGNGVGRITSRRGCVWTAGERPDTLVVEEPLEICVGGRPVRSSTSSSMYRGVCFRS